MGCLCFCLLIKTVYFFMSEKGKEKKYVLDALLPCERDVMLTVRETDLAGTDRVLELTECDVTVGYFRQDRVLWWTLVIFFQVS